MFIALVLLHLRYNCYAAVVGGVNDVAVVVSNATRITETRQKLSDERSAYGWTRRRPPSDEVDGPSTRAVFRRLASG